MAGKMSNSVTNVEIEDVLSSIRRLVSEEGRPRRDAPPQAAERLVLSPALRVPEDEEDHQPDAPMMLTDVTDLPEAQDEPPAPVATLVLGQGDAVRDLPEVADWTETRIAEPVDTAPASDDDPLPDDDVAEGPVDLPEDPVPEDLAEAEQIAALRSSLTDLLDHDDPVETGEAPGLAADYADWTEDGEPLDLDEVLAGEEAEVVEDTLETKIATLEAMLQRQSQDWTPASGDDPSDEDVAIEDGIFAPGSDEGEPPDSDDVIEELVAAAALETVTEQLGETIEREMQEPEPDDGPVSADPSETASDTPEPEALHAKPAFVRHAETAETLDWEDHQPEEPSAAPVSETDAPRADSPLAEAPEHAAVAELSEEALQGMVADIVRRELQGALGERITRNVRKLVRREIHRVMMNQDFD
ncbi:hypothetical protein SAMN05216376_11268 [Mameliella alba]|nr:hypothetical protein LX94_03829 [Mameliella alba]SDD82841.1 hypothetical protein SAMN05216376_11268 [Mameliella alba]